MSKHYLKTGIAFTQYGIGQGSGGGPAVWLCHLIVLFAILEQTCTIPTFTSSTGRHKHKSGRVGYMDDYTLMIQILGFCQSATAVIEALTINAQIWERTLHATGGKLELSKCHWCLILWKWFGGKPNLLKRNIVLEISS